MSGAVEVGLGVAVEINTGGVVGVGVGDNDDGVGVGVGESAGLGSCPNDRSAMRNALNASPAARYCFRITS